MKKTKQLTVVMLLATPFVLSAMLLSPTLLRRRSEFRLAVTASRVTFTLGNTRSSGIFNSIPLAQLFFAGPVSFGVQDLNAVEPDIASPGPHSSWSGTIERARITSRAGGLTLEGVRLHALAVREGRELTLAWDEAEPKRVTVSLASASGGAEVTVIEMKQVVPVTCDQCVLELNGRPMPLGPAAILRFGSRHLAEVGSAPGSGVHMQLWANGDVKLSESDIHLQEGSRIDFIQEGETPTSSIIGEGGSLLFPELGDRSVPIKDGDVAILNDVRDGMIRRLVIDQGISLVVTGTIGSGLKTGTTLSGVAATAPTWAEYLVFGKGWNAYWWLVVTVGTAVLAILTHLRLVGRR